MPEVRPAKKVFHWDDPEEKWRCRGPCTTQKDTVMCDVQHMDIAWKNMLDNATDGVQWRSWMCFTVCTGWVVHGLSKVR